MTPKILVVEDDSDYIVHLQGILGLLKITDFDVAKTVDEATKFFEPGKYDLALVDIMLPKGLEGICLIEKFREADSHVHIIAVSALCSSEYRTMGMEHGADAYIPKNYPVNELIAYIKTNLSRAASESQATRAQITRGDVTLSNTGIVTVNGDSAKSFSVFGYEKEVLWLLMGNPGKRYFQRDIFKTLWAGTASIDSKVVEQCVRRIRHKFQAADVACPIETRDGGGYVVP